MYIRKSVMIGSRTDELCMNYESIRTTPNLRDRLKMLIIVNPQTPRPQTQKPKKNQNQGASG